jgi:hypothetical protein
VFGQLLHRRLVVDVQQHTAEAGLAEGGDVFVTAGGGPDLIAGGLEGLGEGAADAAGASGDEGDGLGHGLAVLGLWAGLPYRNVRGR